MSEVQNVHDILQTEIEYAAKQNGLCVTFVPVKHPEGAGFIVNESSGDDIFIIVLYFRINAEDEVELAIYDRNSFEQQDSGELPWILFDGERISIQDIFLDAIDVYADHGIH